MVPWVSEEVNNTWTVFIIAVYLHAIDLDRVFSLVDSVILQEKTNYA